MAPIIAMRTAASRSVRLTSILHRHFSSWDGHGTDLLSDSLAHNYGAPKIILHAHGKTGFDVSNLVKNMDPTDEDNLKSEGVVHMAGSIIALPSACYMWNVRDTSEITIESLAPLRLYRPKLEYLFIGTPSGMPPALLEKIRQELTADDSSMVIEPMDLANAMGTFNVLNGEDRMAAAALILPRTEES